MNNLFLRLLCAILIIIPLQAAQKLKGHWSVNEQQLLKEYREVLALCEKAVPYDMPLQKKIINLLEKWTCLFYQGDKSREKLLRVVQHNYGKEIWNIKQELLDASWSAIYERNTAEQLGIENKESLPIKLKELLNAGLSWRFMLQHYAQKMRDGNVSEEMIDSLAEVMRDTMTDQPQDAPLFVLTFAFGNSWPFERLALAKALLKRGISVKYNYPQGSLLHCACSEFFANKKADRFFMDFFRLFVKHGAPLDSKQDGKTALMRLASSPLNDQGLKMIELLVEAGADTNLHTIFVDFLAKEQIEKSKKIRELVQTHEKEVAARITDCFNGATVLTSLVRGYINKPSILPAKDVRKLYENLKG